MELKYARFNAFSRLKKPFSDWARRNRIEQMLSITGIKKGMSVLDLGGTASFWSYPFVPSLDITVLNLPGTIKTATDSHHRFQYIEGDACNMAVIADQSFDFVFSNSVIEHVGGPERRAAFAREARRIGKAYWVQTPSIWFPIEAHTGMPLWWFYPQALRKLIIKRWREVLPAWTDMVEGTTVLKKGEIVRLFPGATILVERISGIPKSYTAFKLSPSN
jgi:hypothetical protein